METISATESLETLANSDTSAPIVREKRGKHVLPTSIDEPDYVPPDFSGSRRTRIGASFIQQFVAGHDASDVLRELVQNEYDAGGDTLTLTFGRRSVEVTGNGRNIDSNGWERLSVIVGTGNVLGTTQGDVVAAKENGIGSKNFGLRSLFRFGDQILVRSGGKVALLDLQTQETGRERDKDYRRGEKGVRIHVPYRQASTEWLEPFTVEREQHSIDLMARRVPETLVKLALAGKRRGLREINIRSVRTGRLLSWSQEAKVESCHAAGVTLVARSGKLIDGINKPTRFQEEEFSRAFEIPAEHGGRRFPGYYKLPDGKLKIAVSVPIARKKIDLRQHGHFYYPIKAPSSRTGCTVSVSAPFELNTDRSGINDHAWNDWLIDKAVELTIDLLKADWFRRYGADAFKALMGNGAPNPDRFLKKIEERLAQEACWPTAEDAETYFARATEIVVPTAPEFLGFLSAKKFLAPALAADAPLCDLVSRSGAKRFTLSSLVRLRCADKDSGGLETKVGEDASYQFSNYSVALRGVEMQKRFAAALSAYPRKLTKQHKADLAKTRSTLNANGELMPAAELIIVNPDLWDDCPEPLANRLHPQLIPYKAISGHCREFNEEQWLIDAAKRASRAAPDDRERQTLYRKILKQETPISRAALSELRNNPVVKNQRGEWVAPADMVRLKKRSLARLLEPAIDAPSTEMMNAPSLMRRLRIRESLNGGDLVRYASGLGDRPEMAERFEELLAENAKLLNAAIIEELRSIPCLKARSGRLEAPGKLFLNTPTNRSCIGDDDRIVGGSNEPLYRKLKLRVSPDSQTLLAIIDRHRIDASPPDRAEALYPALVEAFRRERRAKSEIATMPICWVASSYIAASEILVGPRIAAPLAQAIPVYPFSNDVGRAYQELGAATQPSDIHWARFFRHVGTDWADQQPLDARRRRLLMEAYNARANFGLPDGLEEVRCLLDDRSRLFTLRELRVGKLVEPDFPALEDTLRNTASEIGLIDRFSARGFFVRLGIRPLSEIAGTSEPVLGAAGRAPLWYTAKHSERVLSMMRRPLFTHALSEVAYRNRHGHHGFVPLNASVIRARLVAISKISFFVNIERRYSVGGVNVLVPAEVAVSDEEIALTPPKNKTGFQLLLAEALAEIAGATSVSTMRSISNAFLPLLLCGTNEELAEYLGRIGIPYRSYREDDESAPNGLNTDDDDSGDDAEEIALRQVFDNLNTAGSTNHEPVSPPDSKRPLPTSPPEAAPPSPPFELPNLNEVRLTLVTNKGAEIAPRDRSIGSRAGSASTWLPPTPAEIERAGLLGRRGEELVYQMELDKVRKMGHTEPEQYVVWTSRDEPGADHDIRSIDEKGHPLWIEVKSTSGVDGRFDWPRKEFEKALRERESYELWRVYQVAGRAPIAKRFRNPARMLGTRQISLELGMLRANIEKLD